MKTLLQLLVILLIMGSTVTSTLANQNRATFKDSPIYKLQLSPDVEIPSNPAPPVNYTPPSSTLSTPLGQAGNLYTIIRGTSHMVAYDKDINTVLFIHRSDMALGFSSTSDYSYDMSTDGGATWSVNIGPINNNPGADQPNGQARYPQTIIYNPVAGNTDYNNAFGLFAGATHDGTSCNGDALAVWDGISSGFPSLANIDSTDNQNILVETYAINGCTNNALIPNSLTHGEDGEFWATDWVFGNEDYYELILWKGTYSPFGGTVSWDYQLIDFPHDKTFDGTATALSNLIDFSPDGQNGWIIVTGDGVATNCGVAPVFLPIYSRSTDGGDTWSDFKTLELENFDGFIDDGDTTTLSNNQDLYVDNNGDPYLVSAIGNGGDYTVQTLTQDGDTLNVALVHYSNADDAWEIVQLGHIDIWRGEPIIAPDFTNEQRFHISAVDDDVLLVTYLDSDSLDINADGQAISFFRDIKGVAYRMSTKERSAIMHFTDDDPDWGGKAWWWTAAPEGINNNDGTYTVPGVLTDWPNGDLASVYFHYIQDINFSDADINIPAAISVHSPAPPVVGIFNSSVAGIQLTTTETGSSGDICEVQFDWGDGTVTGGLYQGDAAIHDYPNFSAQYNVCVTVLNNDGSDTYCELIDIEAVEDTEAPIIEPVGATCGSTITVSVLELYIIPGAIGTDNVDGDVTPLITVVDNIPFNLDGEIETVGTYTIEYSVSDVAGNTGTCVLTIIAEDDSPPVIDLVTPDNWVMDCGTYDTNWTGEFATAMDNVDGDITANMTITYQDVDDTVNSTYEFIYTVSDAAGNETTVSRFITIINCATSIEEASFANFIDLYPNPTTGLLSIRYDLNNSDSYNVSVYNVLGEMVIDAGANKLNGSDEITLDLSDQTDGIYLVRFENEEGVATKKITLSK